MHISQLHPKHHSGAHPGPALPCIHSPPLAPHLPTTGADPLPTPHSPQVEAKAASIETEKGRAFVMEEMAKKHVQVIRAYAFVAKVTRPP